MHQKKIHEGLNTRPKLHRCDLCTKTFRDLCALKKHVRYNHEGIKDAKCEKCEKSFADSHVLKTHMIAKHQPWKFKCDICPKVYAFANVLEKHKERHLREAEKPALLKCTECEKKFTQKGNLRIHFNSIHKGIRDFNFQSHFQTKSSVRSCQHPKVAYTQRASNRSPDIPCQVF